MVLGLFLAFALFGWLIEIVENYRESEKSKQRDMAAVAVLAEYAFESIDKTEIEDSFNYLVRNLKANAAEDEVDTHATVLHQGEPCPKCKVGYLVRRHGKYGYFLGCNRYPQCTSTKSDGWGKTAQKNRVSKEFLKDLEKAYS